MTSENSQIASRALQICLILGFMVLTTAGWHWGLGRATDLASEGVEARASSSAEADSSSASEDGNRREGREENESILAGKKKIRTSTT